VNRKIIFYLIFILFFSVPYLACKPFQFYPIKQVTNVCRDVHHFTNDLKDNALNFTRRHTYERGVRNLRQFSRSASDVKDSVLSSLDDLFYTTRKSLWRSVGDVKNRVADVVESTGENAKEYCDAGLQKMNGLIDELKNEREKFLGA
jgi:hypothetical protein